MTNLPKIADDSEYSKLEQESSNPVERLRLRTQYLLMETPMNMEALQAAYDLTLWLFSDMSPDLVNGLLRNELDRRVTEKKGPVIIESLEGKTFMDALLDYDRSTGLDNIYFNVIYTYAKWMIGDIPNQPGEAIKTTIQDYVMDTWKSILIPEAISKEELAKATITLVSTTMMYLVKAQAEIMNNTKIGSLSDETYVGVFKKLIAETEYLTPAYKAILEGGQKIIERRVSVHNGV